MSFSLFLFPCSKCQVVRAYLDTIQITLTETITALTRFCNHWRMKKNFRPIIWWILLSSDCIFFNWQARKACGLKQVVCKKAWAFVQNAVLGHHWTEQRFILVIFCLVIIFSLLFIRNKNYANHLTWKSEVCNFACGWTLRQQ